MDTTHEDAWLNIHSPRWNLGPVLLVFLAGTFLGIMAWYVNYKIDVIESHWHEELGQDYPIKKRLWIYRWFHYHRLVSYHF